MAGNEPGEFRNDFSGQSDTVVQAGTVHGGVHFHGGGRPTFTAPRQLPPGVAGFVGRESSLAVLDTLVTDGSPRVGISIITGPPGVGKTALALHWAHRVRRRFPDGDLYIDMRGHGPQKSLSFEQGIDVFLRSLSVPKEAIPVDVEERTALFRSILGDKRILVVIDNVASVQQIRHLLPGSSRCVVLITSRSRLASLVAREGAKRVTLDVLSPEDAVRLLSEAIGEDRVDANPTAALRLAELCSYLPLALRVVGEQAASRPHASVADLVDELESEHSRLDSLASQEDELVDVRAVFSWSYRALTPDQQKVFRLLGLHPGAEIADVAVGALVDAPVPHIRSQLRGLSAAHLVQQIAPDRYRLHDLLRAYSRERALRELAQRERTHAIRRVLGWYLLAADAGRRAILPYSHAIPLVGATTAAPPRFSAAEEAMAWYERERLNLLGALQQACDLGQYDIAWKLPVVADGFFELASYWTEWESIHREGLDAARAVGDILGEASNLLCLGDAHWRGNSLDSALDHYRRAVDLSRQIHDGWLEGFASRGVGLVHQERGQWAQAAGYFQEALGIFRAHGIRRGEGMSLLSLGKVRFAQADLDAAVDDCRQAIEIFTEIGDAWTQAWGMLPFGQALSGLGRLAEAEANYRRAASIFAGFRDRRSQATCLVELGQILAEGGNRAGARECWATAAELLDALGDPSAAELAERAAALSDGGQDG